MTHQAKKKSRRKNKINKNILNQARKFKSKNQTLVKLQAQVMMKVVSVGIRRSGMWLSGGLLGWPRFRSGADYCVNWTWCA